MKLRAIFALAVCCFFVGIPVCSQEKTPNPNDGIGFQINNLDLTNLTFSGLGGQINYAHIFENGNQFCIGVSGSLDNKSQNHTNALIGIQNNTAENYTIGLNASYLFYLRKSIVNPFIGLGISLNYSYSKTTTNAVDITNLNYFNSSRTNYVYYGHVIIPFGVELALTNYFKFGIQSSIYAGYSFGGNDLFSTQNSISGFAAGFTRPSITFSFWF